MAELTVDNFIWQIKSMNDREKGKLRAMDLIALIIQLPDKQSPILVDISGKVEALINTVAILDLRSNNNAAEITTLKDNKKQVEESNKALQVEVDKLSQRIVDIAAENALTDQYLRINNLEIVGLPELGDGETAEDEEVILIEALNSMNLPKPVTSNDIDISHMIQSNRKDNKRVHICKFKSRKTKNMVLQAKKTIIISSSAITLFLLMSIYLQKIDICLS